MNDYKIAVVKTKGEFVWHKHDDTDDFFLVLKGKLRIQLWDHDDIVLEPGELFVVPKGMEHCPRADEETHVLLIEPSGTVNTGDASGALTAREGVGFNLHDVVGCVQRENPRPPGNDPQGCTVGISSGLGLGLPFPRRRAVRALSRQLDRLCPTSGCARQPGAIAITSCKRTRLVVLMAQPRLAGSD